MKLVRKHGPRRLVGRRASTALALGTLALSFVAIAAPAQAAGPSTPATTFSVACPGSTHSNPRQAVGEVRDLTQVFGQRLTDYNNGAVVPLYDMWGENDPDTFVTPPLCGVRYDEITGTAVAEWLFCTDIESKSCGETNKNGVLGQDGTPVGTLEPQSGNARLNASQEKVIAYLIQNGYRLNPTNYSDLGGVTKAKADGTSDQRWALQNLIWCVSDPAGADSALRQSFCAGNMTDKDQAKILASIPTAPSIKLAFSNPATPVSVGTAQELTLTTNIHDQEIPISADGGVLELCGSNPGVTFEDGKLRIAGDDPNVSTTVTLCLTATSAGVVNVSASGTNASTEHIQWNQSPGTDKIHCQTYASFYSTKGSVVDDSVSVSFEESA